VHVIWRQRERDASVTAAAISRPDRSTIAINISSGVWYAHRSYKNLLTHSGILLQAQYCFCSFVIVFVMPQL